MTFIEKEKIKDLANWSCWVNYQKSVIRWLGKSKYEIPACLSDLKKWVDCNSLAILNDCRGLYGGAGMRGFDEAEVDERAIKELLYMIRHKIGDRS